jgi:ribosomal protein L44E
MGTELSYCEYCKRETPHEWTETDDSWRRAGVTDAVSGYYQCTECGTQVRV